MTNKVSNVNFWITKSQLYYAGMNRKCCSTVQLSCRKNLKGFWLEKPNFTQPFIVHTLSNMRITVSCLYELLLDKELTSHQRCFELLGSQGARLCKNYQSHQNNVVHTALEPQSSAQDSRDTHYPQWKIKYNSLRKNKTKKDGKSSQEK